MLHHVRTCVNLLALAVAVGCGPGRTPPPPVPASQGIGMGERTRAELVDAPRRLDRRWSGGARIGAHLDELDLPAPRALTRSTPALQELGASLGGAESLDGGEALRERLDQLPSATVDRLGVAALTAGELYGDTFHPGLCEDPVVRVEAEHGGKDWVIDLGLPSFMLFMGDIEPSMGELDDDCRDALLDAHGDVAAPVDDGDCQPDVEQTFFPAGSDCRACLGDRGGDFDACVADLRCEEEAVAWTWFDEEDGRHWYQVATTFILACAPDWSLLTLVLHEPQADGGRPRAFDHAAWSYMCIPSWDPSIDDANFTCFSGEGGPRLGDGVGEGVIGRVRQMFRKGDREATWFENRSYYAHDLTVGTVPLRWFWLYSDGIGIVSQPSVYPDSNGNGEVDPADENYGYGYGGWGLDPLALRPDGEDPDRLDDLQARDWLAAVSLKTATTRDGVPIHTYNHNRCDEGAWEGPYDDGTWRCTSMHLPDLGFQNDVWNLWVTSEFLQAYPIPVTTLGGTGLPDPDIPGGVVPQIAGTPTLADADWDACSWPATFLPDKAPMEDTPGDWGGPASLLADTWRFDKPSDLDLRLLLSTVQPRGYCGGEVP